MMIYLLGASHMGIVVGSWVHPEESKHRSFGLEEPKFHVLKSRFPSDETFSAASIYIGHYSPWWGAILAMPMENGKLGVAPGFLKLLESIRNAEGDKKLFVFMTGEEHYHLGLMRHEPAIDFEVPWCPNLPLAQGRKILPFHVVEGQISAYLNKALICFNVIRAALPGVPIANVLCPPPVPSSTVAIKRAHDAEHIDLSPEGQNVRLKYYLVYAKILAQYTEGLGIDSLLPPPHAIGSDGLLHPDYVGDDVHGNDHYGQAVIEQIKSYARKD